MAKTKEELVTLMSARRRISELYRDAVINKIYEEYINQIERAILADDVKPVSINRFDVKNLIDQLSDRRRIETLRDISEALPDPEYNDFSAAQGEVISLLIENISDISDCEYPGPEFVSSPTPITICDFDYDDVLDQLTALFEKNGYAPKVYADYNPKKIVISIM